jgi:hypothetical protein
VIQESVCSAQSEVRITNAMPNATVHPRVPPFDAALHAALRRSTAQFCDFAYNKSPCVTADDVEAVLYQGVKPAAWEAVLPTFDLAAANDKLSRDIEFTSGSRWQVRPKWIRRATSYFVL